MKYEAEVINTQLRGTSWFRFAGVGEKAIEVYVTNKAPQNVKEVVQKLVKPPVNIHRTGQFKPS